MSLQALGDVLGKNIQDKDNMKSNVLKHGTENTYFLLGRYYLKCRVNKLLVQSRTIGTAFILGSATNGVLGTSTLGEGTMSGWSTVETITNVQKFTKVGRYEVARWLNSNADASNEDVAAAPAYLGWGTNAVAFSEDSVALGTEKGRRLFSTNATDTGFVTLLAELKSTDSPSIGQALRELGLLIDGRTASKIDVVNVPNRVLNVTLGTSA